MADPDRRATDNRLEILQAIRTPLGFFTLAVLITEALLGVFYAAAPNEDKRLIFAGGLGVLFSLVLLVALMAVLRPEALAGTRATRSRVNWREELREGDTVRIINPPGTITTGTGVIEWTRDMARFYGKRARVVGVESNPKTFKLDIDAQSYSWAPEWLEPEE